MAFAATLLNAFILTLVLWDAVPHRELMVWAGCVVAIVMARSVLVYAYRRRCPQSDELRHWCRRFVIGSLLSGICWGSLAVFLYPESSVPHQLFVAFVLAGMSAGAVVTLAARKEALLAFQLPALLPLTLRMLFQGDELHVAMGSMSAAFALSMVAAAMGWHRMIVTSLATRFENSELLESMAATNHELSLLTRGLDQHSIVVVTDREGRITYVNDGCCKNSRYNRDELIGQTHRIVNSGYHSKEFFHELWTTIGRGEVWKGEIRNRRKDGTFYWVDSTIMPDPGEGGEPERYIAFRTDITERKHAEMALEASNAHLKVALRQAEELAHAAESASRAKSEFLANMSHEIRTPLNGVLGMLELLRDRVSDPEHREYVTAAHKSGGSLLTLLNDILDLSKIEAGRLELEEMDFDLAAMMEDVVRLMEGRAREKGLQLVRCSSNVPDWVRGDPTRLRQVLINLVSNAIKFTARGKVVVRVTTGSNGHSEAEAGEPRAPDYPAARPIAYSPQTHDNQLILRFEVTDGGIGIAPDQLTRIFEAFTQADGSTTRAYGGTGLGLAICTRLVQAMGGEISVASEVGRGSTFWFTVRASEASVAASWSPQSDGVVDGA